MKKVRTIKALTKASIRAAARKAAKELRAGGLIIFPTETVYGIGADPHNPEAVRSLFKAKKRPLSKPFQLLVGNLQQAKKAAKKITKEAAALMASDWPGPLTIVVEKKKQVPDIMTSGLKTVGLRLPDHPVALEIIKAFKGPIAASSANLSGKKPPTTARQAVLQIKDKASLIIDSGTAAKGVPSRIVDATGKKLKVLRK